MIFSFLLKLIHDIRGIVLLPMVPIYLRSIPTTRRELHFPIDINLLVLSQLTKKNVQFFI